MWVKITPSALANVALSPDAKPMAENVFRALWAFLFSAIVIVVVSLVTKPRPVAELDGLVYGATKLPTEEPVPWYRSEYTWALLVIVIFAALNIHVLVARKRGEIYARFQNSHMVLYRSAAGDLRAA